MVLASTLLMLAATPVPPPPPPDPVLRQIAETRSFQNGTPSVIHMDRSGAHVFFLRSPADSPVQSLYVFDVTLARPGSCSRPRRSSAVRRSS